MTDLERINKVLNELYDIEDTAYANFGENGYNAIKKAEQAVQEAWRVCKKGRESHLETLQSSRKPIKSDFDDDGYWTDDEPKSVRQEERHGKFERPNDDVRNKLRPQIEDALDNLMYRKKFGLDKDVYDETVDYVIDLFGEEYPPKNAEEAVQEWYADTKRFFPEMFGKGEKRKVASSLYLKKIRSSRMIKSGRR